MASQLTSYLWDHWPCVGVGCAWCRRPEPLGCLAGSGEGVPWYGCGLEVDPGSKECRPSRLVPRSTTFARVFAALFGRVDSGEISRGSSTAAAVIANTISCSVVSDLQAAWASELELAT